VKDGVVLEVAVFMIVLFVKCGEYLDVFKTLNIDYTKTLSYASLFCGAIMSASARGRDRRWE
jgi:hypothetical protein